MGMRLLRRCRPRPGRTRAALPALTLAGWLTVTALTAAALAGCTVVQAPAPHAHASHPRSAPASGASSTPSPSSGTPQQRAMADALLMLKAFAPPTGARKVSGSPVPDSVLSRSPAILAPRVDDIVTETSWWLVPGDPQRVLAWEQAHIPPLYEYFGGGINAVGVWNDVFRIPAIPGLFDTRDLGVSTTAAGRGQTAIRVDSLVGWIPARPSGDTVPAAARVARLVEARVSGSGTPAKETTTVVATATVTDAAQVAALAAYLNGLAVDPPSGTVHCPMSTGRGLTVMVTFSARLGGPALAQASAGLGGCGFLSYKTTGHPGVGLGGGSGGDDLLDEIDHVTGLRWKIPSAPVP